MTRLKRNAEAVLLVALAAALIIGATRIRAKRDLAIATVDEIEAQLAALDPVTRAAVIARLTADERQAHAQHRPV